MATSPRGKWRQKSAQAVDEAVRLLAREGRVTLAAPPGVGGALAWKAGSCRAGRRVQYDLRCVVHGGDGDSEAKLRHHVREGRAPTAVGKVGADGPGAFLAQQLLDSALQRAGGAAQARADEEEAGAAEAAEAQQQSADLGGPGPGEEWARTPELMAGAAELRRSGQGQDGEEPAPAAPCPLQ